MRKTPTLLVLLTAVVLLSGCVRRLGDLTITSTKNVNIGSQYVEIDRGNRCRGTSLKLVILIPLGVPNIEDAVDECIESQGGDLLTNAVLRSQFYYFIVGQTGFVVEGDVWRRASTSDLMNSESEIFELVQGSSSFELVSVTDPRNRAQIFDIRDSESYSISEEMDVMLGPR